MYKKFLIFVAVSSLFSVITCMNITAVNKDYFSDKINTQEIYEALPEDIFQNLPDDFFVENDIAKTASNISSNTLGSYLLSTFKKLLVPQLSTFCSLLAITVILSLINTSKNSIASESLSRTIDYVTTLVLAGFTYNIIENTSQNLVSFLSSSDTLINALLPAMTLLYTLGGNVSTAVVSSAGISITVTFINYIMQHILLPIIKICFGISLAGMVSGISGISQLNKTLKGIITFILTGTTTLFSIYLLFKTNLTTASDGVAARTIKFAGSFIPIIGSPLGESIRTIMSGISLIKSSVGLVGIFMLILITLPTIMNIILTKFAFDISSTVSYMLGGKKEGDFLKEMSGLYNFLIALSLSVCILILFELTIFSFISPSLSGA